MILNFKAYENIQVVTRSHPDAFPSALRQKSKTQTKIHEGEDALLKVTEQCPKCGHMEAYSKEMQVRMVTPRRKDAHTEMQISIAS